MRHKFILFALLCLPATAQTWDYPAQFSDWIAAETDGKWKLGFESRGRYESRFGPTFGRDVDLETGLVRHRLSLTFNPYKWLKISAMAQDSRAPWFGRSAPNNLRDQLDLQESYLEIAPPSKNESRMRDSLGKNPLSCRTVTGCRFDLLHCFCW